MLDAVKDYLTPKTFSIPAYVCLITQLLCGLVFTSIAIALRVGEMAKFNCAVDRESTASYKTYVEKTCHSIYEQKYNSPLPFYGFVLLSVWFPIIVGVIYSLAVRSRVEEVGGSSDEPQTDAEAGNQVQNRRSFCVFYFYFFHLAIRLLFGLLFTILQYAVFFRSGFDSELSCSPPTSDVSSKVAKNASASQLNTSISITCKNSTASEKKLWAGIVGALNTIFALIIFVEVIHLCLRFPTNLKFCAGVGRIHDSEFITVYFSRKRYTRLGFELTNCKCIDFYRRQALEHYSRTPDIVYGPKTGLDDLFIDVVIHTERAQHKFPNKMDRHEIFDVYMEVPIFSIRLEKVKDLFYANSDTKGNRPRKILAVGRPGIGKTVLTEKIMCDWANKIDEFYSGKIAFYFKFRWFNLTEWKNLTLKKFLCFGTGLSNEKFEAIFEDVTKEPEKALLIFDGLDELDGDIKDFVDHLPHQNDPNISMPAISLSIQLISGHFLPGATILVTSRPTACEFYSRFKFDRNVEIIGFTSEKIEQYVSTFCENHNGSDLIPKMWNHILSSSDLLNLCYIPVNCFIVSTVLFQCLRDPSNETAVLPTTLTELYQAAIEHFDEHHYRKVDKQSSEEAIKKLQSLAYSGIVHGQLVFTKELFDEEMRRSGLLNSLSNPIFPIKTQFCFIHLTIQEFLAAKHVTETQSPEEIKNFISCNIKHGKWHLVLQFIAGILGQKMKMSREEYQSNKDCVLEFAQDVHVYDGKLDLIDFSSVLVMKCLREVGDEDIAKEACERTALNDVCLSYQFFGRHTNSSSEWAAITFVCKHIKKLTTMDIEQPGWREECYMEFNELLKQRCVKQLTLVEPGFKANSNTDFTFPVGPVFKALMESKCTLNHKHNKLTKLNLSGLSTTDESLFIVVDFFKHGHASCLETLDLTKADLSPSGVTKICEVLDNKLCPKLTSLNLSMNDILDEGVRVLCNALIKCRQFKLTKLVLCWCSLTHRCIPSLCELFKDEHCKLTVLNMGYNLISDEGARMLCKDALTKEHCKLADLHLTDCQLTDRFIPWLCELLKDKHCKLTALVMGRNRDISDEGLRVLCEDALTKEHCKLTKLHLNHCSLTERCIPELREALLDERCVLNELDIDLNNFTKKGKEFLLKLQTHEACKARGLEVIL